MKISTETLTNVIKNICNKLYLSMLITSWIASSHSGYLCRYPKWIARVDTFGDLRWSSKSAPLSQHFFALGATQQICFVKELLVICLSLYIYIYTQQHCLHLSSNSIEPNLSNGFLSKLRSKANITLYIVKNMYQGDFPLQFLVDPSDGQFFSMRFTCSESW